MGTLLKNLGLVLLSAGCTVFVCEVMSRILIPVSTGAVKMSMAGEVLDIGPVEPGARFRLVTREYDVVNSISRDGFRGSAVSQPETVFVGDSFTFGQGVEDSETFAYRFCEESGASCANLGVPGTGTCDQVERLKHYLEVKGWRPKTVILSMLVMTKSLGAGNDLLDNIICENRKKQAGSQPVADSLGVEPTEESKDGVGGGTSIYRSVLRHSNLARLVKYYFGPQLKSLLSPEVDGRVLAESLKLTKKNLRQFEELSRQYGFELKIYLIHPVQDILGGTYQETLKEIRALSSSEIESTAPLFVEDPQKYYYKMDGHFNKIGTEKVATFLQEREKRSSR